ncbi:tRNA pseudouridine synthase B [Streptomyces violaceorubidus]
MTEKHTTPDGLVIVDKPSGFTSHDVVAKMRGIARTRRVGHAGTLDPMATGVLVLGVERATKLLGHLALTEKEYLGTIRLGQRHCHRRRRGRDHARPPTPPRSPGRRSTPVSPS